MKIKSLNIYVCVFVSILLYIAYKIEDKAYLA